MQVNSNENNSSWGVALTAEEIEMVGEPLSRYDCIIPTADAQDECHQSDIHNDVSTSQLTLCIVNSTQCRLSAPPGHLALP